MIRELILISKCMMSSTEKRMITIYILSNISRSKGNHAMKFGKLRKYKIRYNFLEKSYTKYDGETSTRPFFEKSKFIISLG